MNEQRLHVLCWAVWQEVAFLPPSAGGLNECLYFTTSHLRLKSVLVLYRCSTQLGSCDTVRFKECESAA